MNELIIGKAVPLKPVPAEDERIHRRWLEGFVPRKESSRYRNFLQNLEAIRAEEETLP